METEVTLQIQDLARGGAGVAREASGRVVFVPYTAPGDRVRARLTGIKKNYAQGELLEIIEPSSARQAAPCPVFGRCGGCQWQHLPYALQWKTKVDGVVHALSRVRLLPASRPEERPAERIWEYRNRVQLRGFRGELGFFAAGSNERVAVDRCAIARPELNAEWERTREEGRGSPRPYKVELEVLEDGSVRKSWNAGHAARGFRQVHDQQNEKLKAWVSGAIRSDGALVDLYGGAGNLSLGLAGRVAGIDCVDTGAPASARLPSNFRLHRQAVVPWIVKKSSQTPAPRYASAILDPPREGLGADFAAIAPALEQWGVRELVAVGCDPDAWARDVSKFVKRGWRLERFAVLDLFPQTPHVESLALLTAISL